MTTEPVPCAIPQPTALPPSLSGLLDAPGASKAARTAARLPEPHPTLTLVLACRSEKNALEAREIILKRHKKDLAKRRRKGEVIPKGWEEGLKIEYELVDLDAVGGPKGILAFTRRISERYPHVTSLFLNAGYAAFKQVVIPRFMLQIITDGFLHALHHPRYNIEEIGAMSADGERGMVWGVNVLSPYIMVSSDSIGHSVSDHTHLTLDQRARSSPAGIPAITAFRTPRHLHLLDRGGG